MEKEMRFTPEELGIIQNVFGNNLPLLKLLRKVFLPTYDPKAPLGQIIDLWLTLDLRNLSDTEKLVRIQARNEVILHVENQLQQLQVLSQKTETVEEALARQKKDSSK